MVHNLNMYFLDGRGGDGDEAALGCHGADTDQHAGHHLCGQRGQGVDGELTGCYGY